MKNISKTIFVGMSGGVDSSVSAALLKSQGHKVVGVYMKNWSGDDYGIQSDCPWEEDVKDVKQTCKILDIPFLSFNFEKEYRAKVVGKFFNEYKRGRTPNPDVLCNKEIKFNMFLNKALSSGADMIATGHYARVTKNKDNTFNLLKGIDQKKDQTYFLYTLNQWQLSKIFFPIGQLQKPIVRKLAKEFKLPTANKKDSQGICFIGDINVQQYLREAIETKPGKIIDIDSKKCVGNHDGIMFYTIGQREGLKIGGTPKPYYVVGKISKNNELLVAMGGTNPHLMKRTLQLENLHLISDKNTVNTIQSLNLTGSIRYDHNPKKFTISQSLYVTFAEKQRAITPGQSLVIYNRDKCLGGGIIH